MLETPCEYSSVLLYLMHLKGTSYTVVVYNRTILTLEHVLYVGKYMLI